MIKLDKDKTIPSATEDDEAAQRRQKEQEAEAQSDKAITDRPS